MHAWLILAYMVDDDTIDAVVGPIFVLGLLAVGAWFLIRHMRRRKASLRWTLIEATIQSEFAANLANPAVGFAVAGGVGAAASSTLCNCVLQYSYVVDGEYYAGYIILGGPYSSRGEVSAAARPWLGKKISVRYNPAQPHQSALLIEDGAPPGMRGLGETPPASSDITTLSLK
jgi:hypothetical protein